MRVVLDVRTAGLPGIGRVAAGLWSGLVEIGADVVGLERRQNRPGVLEQRLGPAPGPSERLRSRPFFPVEQAVMPIVSRRLRADVFHSLHFNVPYASPLPVVLTAHDLFLFLDSANARSRTAALYHRHGFPRAVRRASAVVAVSPFAAAQFAEHLDVPQSKLHVVEHGLDHAHWRRPAEVDIEATLREAKVPRPYVLYVGTAKRHKNLDVLLRAHDRALPTLVLAGPTVAEIAHLATPSPNVLVLGRVPDRWLPSLYAAADALVLPSRYEGVGLTALEAMACGTAVIASNGGGLADTVGDAGLIVPWDDPSAWRDALTSVSADDDLRRRLAEAGARRVAHRSWARAASSYCDIYRAVA